MIVDRHSGAQRELLAAPVPRAYLVLGNLAVALVLAALQVTVLIGLSALRGGEFHITGDGVAWFAGRRAAVHRVHVRGRRDAGQPGRQARRTTSARFRPSRSCRSSSPGALFPIGAMPGALSTIAKFLPLTHALALMRYALVDPSGKGLHDIWGMSNVTARGVARAWPSSRCSPPR